MDTAVEHAFIARMSTRIQLQSGAILWNGVVTVTHECLPIGFMNALATKGVGEADVPLWQVIRMTTNYSTFCAIEREMKAAVIAAGVKPSWRLADAFFSKWARLLEGTTPEGVVLVAGGADMDGCEVPLLFFEETMDSVLELYLSPTRDQGVTPKPFVFAMVPLWRAMTENDSSLFWTQRREVNRHVTAETPTMFQFPRLRPLLCALYTHSGRVDIVDAMCAIVSSAVVSEGIVW
jgi:hypothetical protein